MATSVTQTVNLYATGFDLQNVPDSVATLKKAVAAYAGSATSSLTSVVIDCVQTRFLQSIRIGETYSTIQDMDYCQVGQMWYFITGIEMAARDCAILYLAPDYWLTMVSGTSKDGTTFTISNALDSSDDNRCTIIDGVTERHHVSDDTFGKYTEEDPLMVPSGALDMDSVMYNAGLTSSSSDYIVIGATVSLGASIASQRAMTYTVQAGVSSGDDEGTVTFPVPVAFSGNRPTSVGLVTSSGTSYTHTPATRLYLANGSSAAKIAEAVSNLRAMGVESAIVCQYALPKGAVGSYVETNDVDVDGNRYTTEYLSQLVGVRTQIGLSEQVMRFRWCSSYTPANNRVYVGMENKYVLTSVASGNSAEYLPEELYSSTANANYPDIIVTTDPRASGKPIFAPRYYRGSTSNYFVNCVVGLQWAQVPLVYTDKSGSILDAYNFKSEVQLSNIAQRQQNANLIYDEASTGIDAAVSIGKQVADVGLGNLFTGAVGTGISVVGTAASAGVSMLQTADNAGFNTQTRQTELQKVAYNYAYSQSVVAPEVQFPRDDSIRDFIGNGFMMTHYHYSVADLKKMDKLLTMYGYRDTKPLEASDFTNRSKFNYVQCSDVNITSDSLPKWMCDGCAQQLRNGIRIWHVAPNPKYYTPGNNPVA